MICCKSRLMSGDKNTMKVRLISLAYALLLISGGLCWSSTDNSPDDSVSQLGLTIYLPREIAVENETLTLGKIAVITGEEALIAKASNIELGKFSTAGQIITIDRSLIISRLACSGIPSCNPVLTGADKVSVRRTATVIKASRVVESASSFLANSVKEQSIAKWEPVRMPADVTLPAQNSDVELVGRLVSRGANGQAVVEVIIVSGDKQIETRQVVFRPKYNIRRAVTTADVKEGTALTEDNTKIENIVSDAPEQTNWSKPYGLIASRNLPAGTVVGSNMAKSPQPPVVIERNQNVVIRIERAGLIVTATGKATEKGRLGECIKVKNLDSQRVILAKVNEDGTVEPVF
jgi:flagellar basal body P-ring formation protein FlgA